MIIDSHEHVMLPTAMQIAKMDEAGIDKTILFCSAPHPEKASSLAEIEEEMNSLYKRLAGGYTKEADRLRQRTNIEELTAIIKAYPHRFYGFGSVPLGMFLAETQNWITEYIIGNSLLGTGEFTPGTVEQMGQLETVLQALQSTVICPVWVHTFEPVSVAGLKILMACVKRMPMSPLFLDIWAGCIGWTSSNLRRPTKMCT